MKKILKMRHSVLAIVAMLSVLSINAQELAFEKNNWSVSFFGEFRVEETRYLLNSPPGPGSTYRAPFYQYYHNFDRDYSVGLNASYAWHPFLSSRFNAAKKFFTRFSLGGEFNGYGKNDTFLFNSAIHLGYMFSIRNVGIEIFTGPTGKFAPYRRSYTGPHGFVSDNEDSSMPTDPSQLPIMRTRLYTGGAAWQFGLGINYWHIGVFVEYNQALTDFEHYSLFDTETLKKNKGARKNPMYNLMSVGLRYIF